MDDRNKKLVSLLEKELNDSGLVEISDCASLIIDAFNETVLSTEHDSDVFLAGRLFEEVEIFNHYTEKDYIEIIKAYRRITELVV